MFKEYSITQNPHEPPRKHFSDGEFFELIVWYREQSFKNIVGFQLGYKENPFDTDKEYFFSHFPKAEGDTLEHSTTTGINQKYAAPKILRHTDESPPKSFENRWSKARISLPKEIGQYLSKFIA